MTERPQIVITPENTICPVHGGPFRADWPKGYAVASVLFFTAFCRVPDVQRYCGLDDEGNLADAAKLNAALAEFGPMCCAIPMLTRSEIVEAALSDDPQRARDLDQRLRATP